jgi:hypothetical protein
MNEQALQSLMRRVEALEGASRGRAAGGPRGRASSTRPGRVSAANDDGSVDVEELLADGSTVRRTWSHLPVPGGGVLSEGAAVELAWAGYDPVPRLIAGAGGGLLGGDFVSIRSYEPSGFQAD